MRYRRLGDSGLVVSVVGIGCNNFGRQLDLDGTRAVVDAALEVGITFFDTADIYGEPHGTSEEQLGAALHGRRDDVVVATKFGMDMAGRNGPDFGARGARRYIARAVEASLRRLGTDYIDLYQMHEPDVETPIDETLSALDDLVRAGKVRYLGNSNFAGWRIADAAWTARVGGRTPFVSAQNHYSLLERSVEAEVVPACEHFGLGLLPFFPLANGLLTGKYKRGEPPPPGSRLAGGGRYAARFAAAPWDTIEAIEKYAAERGLSMLQVAIGGLAAQPAVTSVIAGATTPEQVRANARRGRLAAARRRSRGAPRHPLTRHPHRSGSVRLVTTRSPQPTANLTVSRLRGSAESAHPVDVLLVADRNRPLRPITHLVRLAARRGRSGVGGGRSARRFSRGYAWLVRAVAGPLRDGLRRPPGRVEPSDAGSGAGWLRAVRASGGHCGALGRSGQRRGRLWPGRLGPGGRSGGRVVRRLG
jgi:aryl-alcohol dehydrogenase-like predicted oxidoreductase